MDTLILYLLDQMKQKFAEIYGVAVKDIKFQFDGDDLENEQSPDDLEMEDGFMIDAKVSR